MKLNSEQIKTATESLGFGAIDEQHPAQAQLEDALGAHTFFINDNGLFVFSEQANDDGKDAKTARLLVVAAWADEEKKALSPVNPPSPVDVVFDLGEGKITTGS